MRMSLWTGDRAVRSKMFWAPKEAGSYTQLIPFDLAPNQNKTIMRYRGLQAAIELE
jgi:hypothetical protein